jgi:hypothetical protein
MRLLALIIAIGASVATAPEPSQRLGATLYVDDDAPQGGDGRSWRSAHRYLQDALLAARGGGVAEIRVAQGTYKPDRGRGMVPDDQNSAFDLVNTVALRGGYAGLSAPDAVRRDPVVFVTILSGDLLGNDLPNFVNYEDNAYRVVRATGLDVSTLI